MLFSRYPLFLTRLCYQDLVGTKGAWLRSAAKMLTVGAARGLCADLQAGASGFVTERSASLQLLPGIRALTRAECRGYSATPQILAE